MAGAVRASATKATAKPIAIKSDKDLPVMKAAAHMSTASVDALKPAQLEALRTRRRISTVSTTRLLNAVPNMEARVKLAQEQITRIEAAQKRIPAIQKAIDKTNVSYALALNELKARRTKALTTGTVAETPAKPKGAGKG